MQDTLIGDSKPRYFYSRYLTRVLSSEMPNWLLKSYLLNLDTFSRDTEPGYFQPRYQTQIGVTKAGYFDWRY